MYRRLPAYFYSQLKTPNTVLLQTNKFDANNYQSLLFREPKKILTQSSGVTLADLLQEIEVSLNDGFYAAGYISYESTSKNSGLTILPTTWFGIYDKPLSFDHRSSGDCQLDYDALNNISDQQIVSSFSFAGQANSELAYKNGIEQALNHIKRGDVYQVNICGQFDLDFNCPAHLAYQQLTSSFPSPYSAFVNTDSGYVISLSPELFFSRDGDTILVSPMKGTVERGKTNEEDTVLSNQLRNSEKGQAENVMIVDLMRNDLTKIANNVRVKELFKIEKFLRLFQMTSTIEAELKADIGYAQIFDALFPCGSVTGAPKISAMNTINNIERVPRGVYTGAIGYFAPDSRAVFSVAIRTIEGNSNDAKMGVGSGIVWDSNSRDEYEECLLKGKFISSPVEEFSLFETILWNGSYQNLECHLARLKSSAEYFEFHLDLKMLEQKLAEYQSDLITSLKREFKVKISLDRFGALKLEHSPRTPWSSDKVAIWPEPVSSEDRFLYHKTTRRRVYDLATKAAIQQGLADYIFLNERGELTEGSISNFFIRNGDSYFTPPVGSGLLAGVGRKSLIRSLSSCTERAVTLNDLKAAEEIMICNSIRGLQRVTLLEPTQV